MNLDADADLVVDMNISIYRSIEQKTCVAIYKLLRTWEMFSLRVVSKLSQELPVYPEPCGSSLLK